MKVPRTYKIITLMGRAIKAQLNNEQFGISGSLAELDALGGIYIKFLQMIALSGHISQKSFAELLRVYEDSKPDPIDAWEYMTKIKAPNMSRIAKMDSQPFATGSFGQVYHAKLDSGEEVIVKLLRPSVIKYINYDLRLLHILCTLYSLVDRQRMINFKQIFKQFKSTCLQEMQYGREAEVAEYYYKTYEDHPNMVIPKTYLEMCNDQIIVQEYISGISVSKLIAMQKQGIDARSYVDNTMSSDLFIQLEVIGVELLSKALFGDVVQADPHPGNIIILPDNKVALIDFGMSTRVETNRLALYEFLLQYQAYYSGNFAIEELATAALKYLSPKLFSAIYNADKLLDSEQTEKTLADRLKEITYKVTQEQSTKTAIESMLAQNHIMKVLFFEINRGNRFGFSFDLESVILLKAIQGYLTLIGQFNTKEVVLAILDNSVELAKQNMDKVLRSRGPELGPLESLELLSTWLDKMSRNDPWLLSQLAGSYIE